MPGSGGCGTCVSSQRTGPRPGVQVRVHAPGGPGRLSPTPRRVGLPDTEHRAFDVGALDDQVRLLERVIVRAGLAGIGVVLHHGHGRSGWAPEVVSTIVLTAIPLYTSQAGP